MIKYSSILYSLMLMCIYF